MKEYLFTNPIIFYIDSAQQLSDLCLTWSYVIYHAI